MVSFAGQKGGGGYSFGVRGFWDVLGELFGAFRFLLGREEVGFCNLLD